MESTKRILIKHLQDTLVKTNYLKFVNRNFL